MQDDCADVPLPSVPRSSSSTRPAPKRARWQAIDVPMTPPPMTIASKCSMAGRVRVQSGAAVSLSCQRESTACDSQTVAANSAMPAAAIRKSAAKSRGMLSCMPASRIW